MTELGWRARAVDAVRHEVALVGVSGLALGLLCASAAPRLGLAVAAVAALVGAVLRLPALALLAATAVLAGALLGQARLAALDRTALRPLWDQHVAMRVIALEPPRPLSVGGWRAAARVATGHGRGERIVLVGRGPLPASLQVGDEAAVRGRLSAPARWLAFEVRRGAHAQLETTAIAPTGRRRGGLAGFVDGVRRRAERALSTGLPPPQAALARGMVLGQDDALDEKTRDAFRTSGLAHVLAASGQNIALLALLATALVAAAGGRRHVRLLVALGLVALYVPLAGGGPSILRAGIMGGAALVAGLAGRPASRWYALALAADGTLALNPRASGDVGWQLSFAAVVAIAVLAPRMRRALVRRGVARPLAEAAAITIAATLGTAPLMALVFGQVSLISLPANLVAGPAVAPVVWLGTIAGAIGQLGDPVRPLLEAIGALLALPLGFVGLVADAASRAPHATLPLGIGVPAAVAAYVAIAAAAASRRVRALLAGGAVALAASAFLLAPTSATPQPPPTPTVSFLDVGQGDAILLQAAERTVLVDTGQPHGPILDRLRAAGVRRIDLLVVTHGEADHAGAAPRILRALPVAAVLDGAATAPARGDPSSSTATAGLDGGPHAGPGAAADPLGDRVAPPRLAGGPFGDRAAAPRLAGGPFGDRAAPPRRAGDPLGDRAALPRLAGGPLGDRRAPTRLAGGPLGDRRAQTRPAGGPLGDRATPPRLAGVSSAVAPARGAGDRPAAMRTSARFGAPVAVRAATAAFVAATAWRPVQGPSNAEIEAAIDRAGARRIVPEAGQELRVGPFTLEVLWPTGDPAPPGANPNDRAVVLLVRAAGTRMLLTADAESPAIASVDLPPVDILKVAHHGSADPGLPALLERLRPSLAAIEVGRRNSYGHPAPDTLAALRAAGVARVVRTDRDGTVRVTLAPHRLDVATRR